MRIVSEMGFLEQDLYEIDNLVQNYQHQSMDKEAIEKGIIDLARDARGLLEAIETVNFKKYGHTLRTNIRAIQPASPGSSEMVYEREKCISLKNFCAAIVHLRQFTFNPGGDRNHWLDVVNDRRDNYQVFYADFISRLKSLILSKRLVVLALCELAEQEIARGRDADPLSFTSMILGWLLGDLLDEEEQLKLDILKEMFQFGEASDEVSTGLSLSLETYEPKGQMTIKLSLPQEGGQEVISQPFQHITLFKLVRDFYQDSHNPRRVFN